MLHYINTDIVFQEFPDEVALAINISGYSYRCPGCHSQFLWANRGDELATETLSALIRGAKDTIICMGFMGGDDDPAAVDLPAKYIQERHHGLKVGWYTGRTAIFPLINQQHFDYTKVGPYLYHLGGLDSPRTNQQMYRRCTDGSFEDITSRFWKHQTESSLQEKSLLRLIFCFRIITLAIVLRLLLNNGKYVFRALVSQRITE